MIKKKEEWIVMGKAPERCPMCGEQQNWKLVDVSKKGFSVGKAAVGAVLLGPLDWWAVRWERRSSAITAANAALTTNIDTGSIYEAFRNLNSKGLLHSAAGPCCAEFLP